jgi:hypothetical protein
MDEIEALGSDWVLSVAEDQDVDLKHARGLSVERERGRPDRRDEGSLHLSIVR